MTPLTVTVSVQLDGALTLSSDSSLLPELDPFPPVTPWKVREIREDMNVAMRQFKEVVTTEKPDVWGALQTGMNDLREAGASAGSNFFGGPDQFRQVRRFFRAAVPDWEYNDGADVYLQFDAPLDFIFPIELLPVFDYSDAWQVWNVCSLADAARRFVSFGTTCYRIVNTHFVPGSKASEMRHLRISQVRDASLPGAEAEFEAFSRLPRILADPPWPESLDDGTDPAQFIADALVGRDGQSGTKGAERSTVADAKHSRILHFSCHSDSVGAGPNQFELRVQGNDGADSIPLQRLRKKITTTVGSLTDVEVRSQRPMVVMNSCGSASMSPETSRSFSGLFLESLVQGFIGTETAVPDATATTLGSLLYRNLSRGMSVGAALHGAKWALIERHNSPLGALWTSYVDPHHFPVGLEAPG